MNDILTVELTPIKYLEDDNQTKRYHLYYYSRQSPVQLDVIHDVSNQYDDKALQVLYDDVFIGYIRKRYISEDLTDTINDLCFRHNRLKDVKMQCVNGTYIISATKSKTKMIINKLNKSNSILDIELDALVQNTGWIRK